MACAIASHQIFNDRGLSTNEPMPFSFRAGRSLNGLRHTGGQVKPVLLAKDGESMDSRLKDFGT